MGILSNWLPSSERESDRPSRAEQERTMLQNYEFRKRLANEEARQEMINDPTISDKLLAHVSRAAMTEKTAAKMPPGASFEKAMLAIDKDDPRRAMYAKLSSDMPNLLKSLSYGTHPGTAIANELTRREEALKPQTYEYIRKRRGSFFGNDPAPAAGYEEWERKHPESTSPITHFMFGAGMQGAAEFLRSYGSSAIGNAAAPKMARFALSAGKLLSFIPTTPTPLGLLGKLASAGLMTAGAAMAAEKVRDKLVESGSLELSEDPLKRTGQEMLLAAPAYMTAPRLAGHLLDTIGKRMAKPVSTELMNVAQPGKRAQSDYTTILTPDMYGTPRTAEPLGLATPRSMKLLESPEVVAARERQANLTKLTEEDKDSIVRGEMTKEEAIKNRMETNLALEKAKTDKINDEIVNTAKQFREEDPALGYADSINKARRLINPNYIDTSANTTFLRNTAKLPDEVISAMNPQQKAATVASWEKHGLGVKQRQAGEELRSMSSAVKPKEVPLSLEEISAMGRQIGEEAGAEKTLINKLRIEKLAKEEQKRIDDLVQLNKEAGEKQNYLNSLPKDIVPVTNVRPSKPLTITPITKESLVPKVVQGAAPERKLLSEKLPTTPEGKLNAVTGPLSKAEMNSQFAAKARGILHNFLMDSDQLTGRSTPNLFKARALVEEMYLNMRNHFEANKVASGNLKQLYTTYMERASKAVQEKFMPELDKETTSSTTLLAKPLQPGSSVTTQAKAKQDSFYDIFARPEKENPIFAAMQEAKFDEYRALVGHPGRLTKEELAADPAKKAAVKAFRNKWEKRGLYSDWLKKIMGIGALVPVAGLMSALAPNEAEAAPLPKFSVTTGMADMLKNSTNPIDKMAAKMFEAGHGSPVLSDDGESIVHMMRGYSYAPKDAKIFAQTKIHNVLDRLLSPHTRAEMHFDARDANGARMAHSPAVEMADRSQVANANTQATLDAVNNILKNNGIENKLNEIVEETRGLSEKYHKIINLEAPYHQARMSIIDDVLNGTYRSKADTKSYELSKNIRYAKSFNKLDKEDKEAFRILQNEYDVHTEALGKLQPDIDAFNAEHEALMKQLASKYSTARVALAVDGTGMSADNPWLLKMLTANEKVAANKIADINKAYAVRMQETGHDIIAGPYMHHPAHPFADFTKDLEHLASISNSDEQEALRLVKFHSRSFNSKLMVPDTAYIMGKYVPDAAKRIEISEFWKGWSPVVEQMRAIGGYDGALKMFDDIRTAFDPADMYPAAKWLNRYASFEVARLLSLSPSVSFKHILKTLGNWAIFPTSTNFEALSRTANLWARQVSQTAAGSNFRGKDYISDLSKAYTTQSHIYAAVSDMAPYDIPTEKIDMLLQRWNKVGSSFVQGVEMWDRGQTFNSAMLMASKKGMTPEQARYALMDSVLKINFLTGPNNPKWLKDPFIRTMLMFQGTPFKILEQRAMLAYQAGKDVKRTLDVLNKLRKDVKTGENNFKWHMLNDELTRSKDIYGNPYTTQFLRQMMTIGGVILTGKYAFDSELMGHTVTHIPGLQLGERGIQLGVNPLVSATYRTIAEPSSAMSIGKMGEDEFWLSRFFNHYFSNAGFPAIAKKMIRLRDDDIPTIYKDNKLNYLFGVPRIKEE